MRKAILIGNDRFRGPYLPGVSLDIRAMREFLTSPAGGAWQPQEMVEETGNLRRDTLFAVIDEAKEAGVNYFFIYFAGHGQLGLYGTPTFFLPGGEEIQLDEIENRLNDRSVLMISDSCQGNPNYRRDGMLNENRLFPQGNQDSLYESRRQFDVAIQGLPPSFVYASAVSPGQYAEEIQTGGCYTQHLLQACQVILNDNENNPPRIYYIAQLHEMARIAVITNTLNRQRPNLMGIDRMQPPFLVKL